MPRRLRVRWPGSELTAASGAYLSIGRAAQLTRGLLLPASAGGILLSGKDGTLTYSGGGGSFDPATTRYIRQGATGNGTGTDWTNAYSTWPTMQRGFTYYVADGSYGNRTFSTAASGTTPITIKKAIESDHGTGTGWNSTYGDGQAVFGRWEFQTKYWVLDGQTGGGAVNDWGGNFGFKLTEPSIHMLYVDGLSGNVTCRHIEFYGGGLPGNATGNDGCEIRGPNFTLSHYTMQNLGKSPFWMGGQNIVIEHGWVGEFAFGGDQHCEIASLWDIGSTFGDITFRYNLFTHLDSTGGIMWDNQVNHNAACRVYGNVWYKPPVNSWAIAYNGCVGGWSGGNGEDCYNLKVFNNSFVNVDQATLGSFPIRNGGCEARNNIFRNCDAPDFGIYAHNHNHFIASGGVQGEANGTSAASGDPFVDYVNFDFRLKAATAAADSTIGATYATDPYGLTRGADGVWDRGAYEFAG